MAAKLGVHDQIQSIIELELTKDDSKVSDQMNESNIYSIFVDSMLDISVRLHHNRFWKVHF